MNMYNEMELNEDFVVDIELSHIERLIEMREAYEEEFFSLEPSDDEYYYMISQYNQETAKQELDYIAYEDFEDDFIDLEYEDDPDRLRDEKLIKEREEYESSDSLFIDDFALNDFYDLQIAAKEEEEFAEVNGYGYDFKYEPEDYEDYEYDEYEEEMFYHLLYLKESQLVSSNCGCAYLDYMPNDDGLCDYLDCYDYPEGPDENLWGVKYY